MNKLFKYIGVCAILIFSFYYTEKVNDIVVTNNELFSEIEKNSYRYQEKYVNATITDDYIIPGLNGLNVDIFESYHNMKSMAVFNESSLVYEEITPVVSVQNNKNKIIKSGNKSKKNISLIFKDNNTLIDYCYSKNILFSRLVTINSLDERNYEQINNDTDNFDKVDGLLNKKTNTNICVLNYNNENICRKKKKYLVEETFKLNNYNISNIKNNVSSGVIILVEDNVNLADFKILLKQISYQDLKIVRLSTLISENR